MQCSNDHNFALELFWIHRFRCSWCWKHPRFKMSSQLKMIFLSAFIASPRISQAVFIQTYVTFSENSSSLHHLFDCSIETSKSFSYKFIEYSDILCLLQSLLSNNFFHQFFYSFSLSRKWQVPSATVNRVLLSQISIELSLLLKRYWKFFKKWFIHQERKTNFCPQANGRAQ